jgi:hypothetical protein
MNKTSALHENMRFFRDLAEEAKRPYVLKSTVRALTGPLGELSDVETAHAARRSHVRRESILNLIRIEVAMLQYKAANGQYPIHLSELGPAYITAIPNDPFTGTSNQQYHYAPAKMRSAFVLYGLGPDMTDHGGKHGRFAGEMGYDIVGGYISCNRKLFP